MEEEYFYQKVLKEQEAKGLLNNLMKVKIPFLSDLPMLKEIF